MITTAKAFMDANTWVLAAVTREEKDEIVALSQKFESLFAGVMN
jgi:hypothetical protein